MSRREFLARTVLGGAAATTAIATPAPAYAAQPEALGKFIDLTKCAGCGECGTACSTKNAERYPDPVDDIPVNWPVGKYEDWSQMKDATDRLTPYNWTFVEKVEVDGHTLTIPRQCMHCDNPACANICPFGAQEKTAQGAVVIDHDTCMGGAKCRDVCPWNIPQRQAGVGLYMEILPGVMGGGVMYKCDMCSDLIAEGGVPACVSACPTGAMQFGDKEQMKALATARAETIGGHIYGADENGCTSTFYVSPVPFEAINAAIAERKAAMPEPQRVGVPHLEPNVENFLETNTGLAKTMLAAPVLGVAAAGVAAIKAFKRGESR